jgi:hypothetical protein
MKGISEASVKSSDSGSPSDPPYILSAISFLSKSQKKTVEAKVRAIGSEVSIYVEIMKRAGFDVSHNMMLVVNYGTSKGPPHGRKPQLLIPAPGDLGGDSTSPASAPLRPPLPAAAGGAGREPERAPRMVAARPSSISAVVHPGRRSGTAVLVGTNDSRGRRIRGPRGRIWPPPSRIYIARQWGHRGRRRRTGGSTVRRGATPASHGPDSAPHGRICDGRRRGRRPRRQRRQFGATVVPLRGGSGSAGRWRPPAMGSRPLVGGGRHGGAARSMA